MSQFWKLTGRVSLPRAGLIAFVVLLLLSCFLLSIAGDNVAWLAVMTLPLMLPLTMGTRSQKILACCCLVLSLILICRDNQAANDRTRSIRQSYRDRLAELEEEVGLLRSAELHSDPRALGDSFVRRLIENPSQAHALMEDDFRSKTSANDFESFVEEMFPAFAPTSKVEFIKAEHGFVEEDGTTSSEYCYRVIPGGDAAAIVVNVNVVKRGNRYYVRRFAVPSP